MSFIFYENRRHLRKIYTPPTCPELNEPSTSNPVPMKHRKCWVWEGSHEQLQRYDNGTNKEEMAHWIFHKGGKCVSRWSEGTQGRQLVCWAGVQMLSVGHEALASWYLPIFFFFYVCSLA